MTGRIALSIEGEVAILTLGDGRRRNPVNMAIWRAIPLAAAQAAADPAVKVLILRGRGGHFGAGADIAEFDEILAGPATAEAFGRAMIEASEAIERLPIPVVAAIEGYCMGGSVPLALACDLRIAADSAVMALTPAKMGIVYPMEELRRVVRAVGPSRARDLLYTARAVAAEECLRIGLVDRLAPAADFEALLDEVTSAICAAAPITIRSVKAMVRALSERSGAVEDADFDWFMRAVLGPDLAEGHRAFLEKRPPRFPGA